ncbi:phage tail tape measure protein [Streptomyces sp. NPDC059515]|uniref:phage tail tape measure protein n=1 Tax=Streptomyces sp. NPDC059515 TaxID=3346854 RepID=UPI0036C07204
MALTVGELLAVIDVDATAMRSGLADAERRARTSGDQIGTNVVRGADGRLRDMRGRFVQAGQDAGQGLADGVGEAGGQGAEAAGGTIAGRLGDSLKAGLAGAGLAAGAMLVMSFTEALDQGKITARLGAQLGATPAEAEKYGKLAGRLYSNAVTEDFQTAADTISAVMRAGIAPPDATEAQLESIATKVADVASTFELDLGQTANAVGQMLKTGLAKDGTEALDAITAGMQKMGPRADDLMDTFNEYSVQFQRLGLDATTATGLISQGMKAGARDTDVVADALKEFTLEGVQGSEKIATGFEMIGLNADDMIRKISEGGPSATEALQLTLDALRDMEDPVKRDAAAVELFGTKSEDMQKALLALDPSKATKALGDVGGKAAEMGDALRDNAGTRIEQFKRGLQQNVVEFLGGTVIPGMDNFRTYVTGVFGDVWSEAAKGAEGGADQLVNAAGILGQRLAQKIRELAPKAIEALIGFGQDVADYVTSNPMEVLKIAAIAGAILTALAALPMLIAVGLAATAALIVGGFVANLVSFFAEKIPELWTAFTDWVSEKAGQAGTVMDMLGQSISTWFGGLWGQYVSGPVSRTWSSWVKSVQDLPGRSVVALSSLGSRLSTAARGHVQRMKDAAVDRALSLVTWLRGLPGRMTAAIGALNSLLYDKGRDVVRGLWNGIRDMGGWLRDTLTGWAKDLIPGPIAKALGISSPSKLMRDRIGRWIPAGVVEGIKGGSGAVRRAMETLVPAPELPAFSPAAAAAAGGYGAGSPFGGRGGGGPLLHVEHWHAAENGSPDDNARALEWRAKGRG